MNTYQYKTTMSCSGCVSKVEQFLNEEKGILKWSVDLNSPDKLLTIETETIDPSQIPAILQKAGYRAERV